jgi:CrcB protein
MTILGIMLGGALGALARYGTNVWLQAATAGGALANFPLATLLVNVVGSFLISLTVTSGLQGLLPAHTRLAITTGFLGALTTFSTFELESDLLFRGGQWRMGLAYVLGNLVLGYLALLAGRWLGVRLTAGA